MDCTMAYTVSGDVVEDGWELGLCRAWRVISWLRQTQDMKHNGLSGQCEAVAAACNALKCSKILVLAWIAGIAHSRGMPAVLNQPPRAGSMMP